ncbi:hypothetical protein KAJ27_22150 [bacterium]|nr:hypothetical protein [bacterium]
MTIKSVLLATIILVGLYLVVYVGIWQFGICRVYVGENEVLVVQQKMFGKTNKTGVLLVPEDTIGVWKRVFVTGRYFFNPLVYQVEKYPLTQIDVSPTPGRHNFFAKVGIVNAKVGKKLPRGEFLANKDQQGIWKQVLTPGKYAINPKGYTISLSNVTNVPTGYVGCITTLSGSQTDHGQLAVPGEKGIQKYVLNPGIYPINPRAKKIDIVEVGYNLLDLKKIEFPSADGFSIQLDMSVVWGLLPENVPAILSQFGNVSAVVNKIINPQVTSICMLEGSELGAKQFIEGESREEFQNSFTKKLKDICSEKKANVQICLVRDIEIPRNIKDPIQQAYINVELKLTKDVQKNTQKTKAELQTLIADVEKGRAEVRAETERLCKNIEANGNREVARITADAEIKIADINRQISETNAKADLILGEANAKSVEMVGKARSDKFQQFVNAFGSPEAYINWTFANSLSNNLSLNIRYSGEGTFWTDVKTNNLSNDTATLKLLNNARKRKKVRKKKKVKPNYKRQSQYGN